MESRLNAALIKVVKEKKLAGVAAIALDKSGTPLYKGAFGTVDLSNPNAAPFSTDTPLIIWSCTKLIVSVAALQLIEQGKLKLDDPVDKYVPQWKDIKVIAGWNEDGTPQLREPKTTATVLNLLTHTGGFTYDFMNANQLKYKMHKQYTPGAYSTGSPEQYYDSPLEFDPGTKHEYGINVDWLGFVIESVTGQKLPQYVKENILDPLGMKDTAPRPEQSAKGTDTCLIIHHRSPADGSLTADPNVAFPPDPPIHGGGHYLYSTLDDYAEKFLLALLNYGTHPKTGVQILKKDTAEEYLFKEKIESAVGCSAAGSGVLISTLAPATNDGELLPGLKKSWSCGLLVNLEDSPIGRSAGSGAWCGFGNLYYWIDPKKGYTGMIATETLPFLDPVVLKLFDELERATYGYPPAKEGERMNYVSKTPAPLV